MTNNHSTFVEKNIRKKLLDEGYRDSDIHTAVNAGVNHYKNSPHKSIGIFSESLRVARQHLKGTKKAS